jgi:hypothetical protein
VLEGIGREFMEKVTPGLLYNAYHTALNIMKSEPAIDASVDAGDVEIDGVIHTVIVKIEENED